MVTDDPGTPGDGHFEINLGAIASHTPGHWEVAAPAADINYGWGDHAQLKLELPWVTSRDDGQHWRSALGQADVGVKWRFLDPEQTGFSMSTYPQYTGGTSWMRRGTASEGHEFFLPVEAAGEVGSFEVAAEVGRNFVSAGGANQWVVGVVAGHVCGGGLVCMAEVHATQSPQAHIALLNFGARWKFDETLAVLLAAGREFGTAATARRQALAYIGVQITH